MEEELLPGVRALDHTADVGLELVAPDRAALFRRAAAGMEALIAGPPAPPAQAGAPGQAGVPATPAEAGAPELRLELEAPDVAVLLADWLRELLYLRQVRGRAFADAEFTRLDERELAARVRTVPAPAAAREIKGVTYHGLDVRPGEGGWRGRVIFDV